MSSNQSSEAVQPNSMGTLETTSVSVTVSTSQPRPVTITHSPVMVQPPSLVSRQELIGGMMVVSSTPHGSGSASQSVLVQPLLPSQDELHKSPAQLQRSVNSPIKSPQRHGSGILISPIVATGSTIHHHGQNPLSRGTGSSSQSLAANPVQQQLSGNMSEQQHQLLQGVVSQLSSQVKQGTTAAQLQQPRISGQTSPISSGEITMSGTPLNIKTVRTSPLQSPERVRKRLKLEEKPASNPAIGMKRKLICDYKLKEMAGIKDNYKENLTELFFLQNGGNIMEFLPWKKKPTPQLLNFLRSGALESDDEDSEEKRINNEVKVLTTSGGTVPIATPVAISTSLPVFVASASQDQSKRPGGRHGMIFGHVQPSLPTQAPQMPGGIPLSTTAATTTVGSPGPYNTSISMSVVITTTTTTSSSTPTTTTASTSSSMSMSSTLAKIMMAGTPESRANSTSSSKAKSPVSPNSITKQHSISAVYENAVGSQEAIVERAKQEAQVLQRVAELRKEGLWSSRRLPKVQEPSRNKTHWDYLLEEMQWLAADFAQERKWKKAGARKVARMITKHFQELQQKEIKAEKEEGMKVKRIASNMAKMVKEFWSNIEKVVQYKQQSRLDEKRKKALDLHLSFIVDQTEKYSSWLTEGLKTASFTSSNSGSICSPGHPGVDDGDFEPLDSGSDDEETIDQEEAEEQDETKTKEELDDLQRENELPLEELLKTLPKEVLEKPASLHSDDSGADDEQKSDDDRSDEYQSEEDSNDNESTLDEQEQQEDQDHESEINELKNEGEMSIEELMKKYQGAFDSDVEAELSQSTSEEEEDEADSATEDEEEQLSDEEIGTEDTEEVGIKFLTEDLAQEDLGTDPKKPGCGTPNKEITDIAAAAQSIQPTGYTLETTQVKTKVPFLLKHSLREYQHVGLDWLATLHERKLNGILADEMGLGKTIQTIAVLAHLATEWGVWGPHLIVVPTSVMLNWEMELKKWCPSFKILTYYGSQKERKLKRTGWTKTNAFHVCITSYKLVIQDHQAFRRKKWKYLILDEAQNIKNFKSQRWQTLLNFSSQRRLLLTGTPLQNNLMELWSLMHFLMPHVFQSHKEFKEWFANPLSGMIEGSREYNEQLIRRLHKVMRPFLLRRLKADVEKQMPKKYEHVVMCRLSRRQRFLYDEFMAQTKTKETLATGHFMSVINILMQLRKVCNHPNLFDPRPIQSPFHMEGLTYSTPSMVLTALQADPLESIDLCEWYPGLTQAEMLMTAFSARRISQLQTPRKLIEEIDLWEDPEPTLKRVATCAPFIYQSYASQQNTDSEKNSFTPIPTQSPAVSETPVSTSILTSSAASTMTGNLQALPALSSTTPSLGLVTTAGQIINKVSQQSLIISSQSSLSSSSCQQVITSHPITVQIHQTQQGTRLMIPSGSLSQLPAGFIQIVQTSSGQQLIATSSQALVQASSNTVMNGPSITVGASNLTTTVSSISRPVSTVTLPLSSNTSSNGKPVVKVSPMSVDSCRASTEVNSSTLKSNDTAQIKKIPRNEVVHETEFTLPSLLQKIKMERHEKLARISNYNEKRCDILPTYGIDLRDHVDITMELPRNTACHARPWAWVGRVHCSCTTRCAKTRYSERYWQATEALSNIIHTPQQYMEELKDMLDRFVFVFPPATAPRIQMHASHPAPSWLQEQRKMEFVLKKELSPKATCLHNISSRMTVQFPELRLIQYDCGKLQTLDVLLAQLKSGQHRVLIFTQMTRMLDILEQFLSYHGHRYLRLDGTTKVEQRQILMDRFNLDKRIFCFILSTRSGGIGVNLTGADTVIFYDSDWNPTMDAQAQDRCHRIGQTRDVHIYRLVSEMTIEENILKKANQKRLLGDVAIEGGNFTAAFFKQNTIKELFDEPSGLSSLVTESEKKEPEEVEPVVVAPVVPSKPKSKRLSERLEAAKEASKDSDGTPKLSQDQYEQALCAAEEDTDIQAVSVVKAEQQAELAEFDESIPWDEREAELKKERDEEMSKVEQELAMLEKELTAVERFAVQYMEEQLAPETAEELEKAEEDITIAKEEWELGRLQALKEEEERRAELEEDEMLFTYSREDSQAFICDATGEQMPMWAPPTPPQDDNDIYIDRTSCFMYEPQVMLESQLPAVYVKKEMKRIRLDPAIAVARKHKVRKEEHHRVPRSLFDRPQSLLRKERELKLMKLKQFAKPLKPLLQSRPMEAVEAHSDWLVHEDWALLQALQVMQELPLSLATDSPAVIPNWDLVADMVNACSRTYRSIKQCRNRYENVIVPREEGKILYDVNPRKQKKSKGIYKTKNNRPMRTSQLFLQDNNNCVTSLYSQRFDACNAVASKRTPTIRPTLSNPTLKNPKHAAVLAENGINYEQPLTPTQVAANRSERIAKEKQKDKETAQQQHLVNTAQRAISTPVVTTTVAIVTAALAGTTTVQTATGQQLAIVQGAPLVSAVTGAPTTVVVTAAGLQKAGHGSAVAALSLARTIGPTGSIVVNPSSTNPFAAINKRIAGQTVIGTVGQTLNTTSASIAQAVRAARSGQLELAAVVSQSPARIGTSQVITSAALTPQQILAAQKTGTVTVSNITAGHLGATKTLTPQQLQILRLKQQQLRRITAVQAAQQSQTVTGVVQAPGLQKTLAVSTPLITSITQSQMSSARLQLAKQPGIKNTTVTRSLSEAEMAVLLKRQQLQQRALGATIVSQGTSLQPVQVSQGTIARILTGTQVQQLQAGATGIMSSGAQPVATLVKTVSTQGSATIPSVTIPVSLGISVNVPTQKAVAGKTVTQQQILNRQLHLQQLQRSKVAQQKVATLGQLQQVAKATVGNTPLIMTPQQQTSNLPKVMVQQIFKQQPAIQQIIASGPQSTTATVIATQLVSQAQPTVQTVTKMSVPSLSSTVTLASRVSTPLTVSGLSGTSLQSMTMVPSSLVSGTPTVTLTPSQATLVKSLQLQDVLSSQKPLTGTISNIQQVKTVQHATGVRQHIQQGGATVSLAQITSNTSAPSVQVQQLTSVGQTLTVSTTPKILQQSPATIVQHLQPVTTVTQINQPPPAVQQAVQKVVQEAQAQAQHRVAVTIGGTSLTHPSPVTHPTTITQSSIVVTSAQAQAIQQLTINQSQANTQGEQSTSGKNSPYSMRLRNQRS